MIRGENDVAPDGLQILKAVYFHPPEGNENDSYWQPQYFLQHKGADFVPFHHIWIAILGGWCIAGRRNSLNAICRGNRRSNVLRANCSGMEVLLRKTHGFLRIKSLARVNIDTEKQHGLFPCIEMRPGRLPMDPACPSEFIGAVSDRP
jgi:hypothetical protein